MFTRMDWLFKRLENVNTVAGIATLCGVPISAVVALVALIWARLEHLRWSYVLLVLLAVFALILWSWIGIVWLLGKAQSKPLEKPKLDCAWGIAIDAAFLTFAPANPMGCQVSVQMRNLLSWPVRCEIISHTSDVNGVVPNMKVAGSTSVVIMQGSAIGVSFDGYSQGTIPQQTNYSGTIQIHAKYGHPDIGMSREMTRAYTFQLQLQPHPFQMLLPQPVGTSGTTSPPPLAGKFPLPLNQAKPEEDKPL